MKRRLSRSLVLNLAEPTSKIECVKCGHALVNGGEPWKQAAVVREISMQGAGGFAFTGGKQVILRRFFCPGCGSLLDTETAVSGAPYLDDIVKAEPSLKPTDGVKQDG
jgi:acetone carboxylase gamma subunit